MTDSTEDPESATIRHARHGKLGYVEIPATDIEASVTFYETVFRWKCDRRDATTAAFDDGTGELIGHWVTGRAPTTTPGILPYIYVEDVAAAIETARRFASAVLEGPRPEAGLTVATITDPAGNAIGIWHAG